MKQRWQQVAAVSTLVLIIGLALGLGGHSLVPLLSDRQALEAFLAQLGPWAPIAVILAEIFQVLLAPVPGQAVGIVAGYLYGIWWGTALCMVGLVLGTILAIWIARQIGRPLVERLASPELIARLDGYVERRGVTAIFVIFLLPFLPDDLTCLVAGLTPLSLGQLVPLALLGRLPGVLVSCWVGSQAHGLSWEQMALVVTVAIPMAVLFLRYQSRLEAKMFAIVERIANRR